ncbi:MAG: hypothetical protein V1816_18815 [Pseudomonadota bacterium]
MKKLFMIFCALLVSTIFSNVCVVAQECSQFRDQGQGQELRCLGIYFTNGDDEKLKLIQKWRKDKWSGYPDLEQKLKTILRNCASTIQKDSINDVPLDNIEGWYRLQKFNDTDKVEIKHDEKFVLAAYIEAWKERNSGFTKAEKETFSNAIKKCSTLP